MILFIQKCSEFRGLIFKHISKSCKLPNVNAYPKSIARVAVPGRGARPFFLTRQWVVGKGEPEACAGSCKDTV